TLVTATAGALPVRTYDAHVSVWWQDLIALTDRVAQMSRASALVAVDLHEVPPPSRDEAHPERRVIRLQGDLRIATLGYEPAALPEDGAQASLDAAKAWLDGRVDLGRPLQSALEALPPECVVEKITASPDRLEVRVAGVRETEADQYADRLSRTPEIGGLYPHAQVSRNADTFIITLDRKP
ncbi:MAG TPA: hypothetical protein VHF22_05755, partial [Planctomycetota bacterium]|nr:hypothetical protein [Planctomycetota bacterium]